MQPQTPPQGYPQQGYPPQQQGAYPPQQPGAYPPQQQGAYPPQQGYPPQQQGAYPPQQGAYPPQQGYPPQQPYPGQAPVAGYPPQVAPGMQGVMPMNEYYHGYYYGIIRNDINHDADILRKAMKGVGTNESDLIKIIANRCWVERDAIKKAFSAKHSKDLIHEIKSEVSGNFEKCLVSMLTEPAQYDVEQIHSACEGAGTNENTLIEILVPRSNTQKELIKQLFQTKYGKSLKSRLESECSGDFKKLMEKLCEPRDENPMINPAVVVADSEALYKAGEGKIGTDEKVFINILAGKSFQHIAAVASDYAAKHKKHSLVKAIESEMSGSLSVGLIAIVTYATNPYGYFADLLNKSMRGAGTNDNKLIRTVVTQMHQIQSIKNSYSILFKNSLQHDISNDCSGDFKKLLIDIIN